MGISAFIKSICVQTAVYWGSPVKDGYGGATFNTPVEILCRWEWKEKIQELQNGKLQHQKGQVLVTEDLDLEGYLYLGSLTGISGDVTNPLEIEGTYQIIEINKIPMIKSSTEFVRTIIFGNIKN